MSRTLHYQHVELARDGDGGFPINLSRLEVALWLDHTVRV